jgi:hypothetical protein
MMTDNQQQHMNPETKNQNLPSLIIPALLLLAYVLPWQVVPTIGGLTNGAYDLAEWISIHPAVRGEPFLLTALLLRLPLVMIAWWVGASGVRKHVGTAFMPSVHARSVNFPGRAILIMLIAIALLPPLEFLTSARSDPNYQQQFMLACLAFIGGMAGIALAARNGRIIAVIGMVALIIGAAAGIWGLMRALGLMAAFGLDAQVGAGAILFALITAFVALPQLISSLANRP